ncbi:hypothetical protein B4099_1203 [Heyndrickxia coagulans]|uniref:Uncharacterized protein n=1 Tax=Heyndrickxia coagulans TaxID=1398 RepID=A0A150KGR2_HEYCO|nr:hypothetical protein B4099_1203 [Heyndrickxia coagulans]
MRTGTFLGPISLKDARGPALHCACRHLPGSGSPGNAGKGAYGHIHENGRKHEAFLHRINWKGDQEWFGYRLWSI